MSELKSETETKIKTHEVRGTKKKKKPARQIEATRGPLSSGGKKRREQNSCSGNVQSMNVAK